MRKEEVHWMHPQHSYLLWQTTGGRSAAFYNSKFQLVETIGNEDKISTKKYLIEK